MEKVPELEKNQKDRIVISVEIKGIEVPIQLTWEVNCEEITLFIEINETGQKTKNTCDWDVEGVDFLNAKQLCMMYGHEILEAVCEIFDPQELKPEIDDFEDFYNDKF